jgi:hypothetical protein
MIAWHGTCDGATRPVHDFELHLLCLLHRLVCVSATVILTYTFIFKYVSLATPLMLLLFERMSVSLCCCQVLEHVQMRQWCSPLSYY